MFLNELTEPQLLVIYPGRFQPFHKGHHAVFEWLANKFGRNNIFIATSNKTDNLKSPFTFAEKAYFMQLTGVPADRIVEASSPYNIENVLSGGRIHVADRSNTVVLFAISQKDMEEDPRFGPGSYTKKDGSPAYMQPLQNIKDTKSMDQHGYIMTVPTFDFTVLGQPMRSGTELRKLYSESDDQTRRSIIQDLFGRYTAEAEQIMNSKIPAAGSTPPAPAALPKKVKLQPVKTPKEVAESAFDMCAVCGQTPCNCTHIEEATIVKDPTKPNLQIRPTGGMGTWDEPSLVTSLSQQLDELINKLKYGSYKDVEYLLYRAGAMQSKIQALARLEDFMRRRGRRPIAANKEIDIG